MMINIIKKKKSAARFAMSSGGALACILINVLAASLYIHNRKLTSNCSIGGTTQASAAATHLDAHASCGLWHGKKKGSDTSSHTSLVHSDCCYKGGRNGYLICASSPSREEALVGYSTLPAPQIMPQVGAFQNKGA